MIQAPPNALNQDAGGSTAPIRALGGAEAERQRGTLASSSQRKRKHKHREVGLPVRHCTPSHKQRGSRCATARLAIKSVDLDALPIPSIPSWRLTSHAAGPAAYQTCVSPACQAAAAAHPGRRRSDVPESNFGSWIATGTASTTHTQHGEEHNGTIPLRYRALTLPHSHAVLTASLPVNPDAGLEHAHIRSRYGVTPRSLRAPVRELHGNVRALPMTKYPVWRSLPLLPRGSQDGHVMIQRLLFRRIQTQRG